MNRTIIGTITDKAETSFGEEVTRKNFHRWRRHWIGTGRGWSKVLTEEGLVETAAKVDECVEFEIAQEEAEAKRNGASFCWANFCKMVYYGMADWPSYSYWIVPGTITNEERV